MASDEQGDTPTVELSAFVTTPRHQRRVVEAARRVGLLDEKALLDDWAQAWLRFCRRQAIRGGHPQEDIDSWTMDGLVSGRGQAA
jgi:hypothetical protein